MVTQIRKRKTATLNMALMSLPGCYGHMLELYDPEDYDEKYSRWSFGDLPIKSVYPPQYKIKPESEVQTRIICLLSIKPTVSFILATPMMKDVCWSMRF